MTAASASPSAQFWEARYSGTASEWGHQPNVRLTEILPRLGLRPGLAWDLGCGHGGDALWLASLGWHVTATDVSATAVSRVAAAAMERELRDWVTAQVHDLSRSRPEGTFHLVYACYFHSPVPLDRDQILRDAAELLRPGGCLVLIDHASAAPWSWRPEGREREFPTPTETLLGIGLPLGWGRTEVCERSDRVATGPDGQAATVTDNILALRRT